MSDTYDKSTKLNIDGWTLDQAKFMKTLLDEIAVRVGNSPGAPLYTSPVSGSAGAAGFFPTVFNVADKDTKEEHEFQEGTRGFLIRCETVTKIKYNFDETAFDGGEKLTITSGGFLFIPSGLSLSASTKIFFETDRDNVDVEILEWK